MFRSRLLSQAKVGVLFHSLYGHNFAMAKAAVEGAKEAGATVELKRFAETLPANVLELMHATESVKAFADVPVAQVNDLVDYDGIIILSPTRFGSVSAQVQSFLDQTGQLWFQGKLIGKVGSAMVSSATQHGGQETTFSTLHNFFLHHGMVIAGLPGSFAGTGDVSEMHGLSPYGATTVTGTTGARLPSQLELDGAKFQGKHVATLAAKLKQ